MLMMTVLCISGPFCSYLGYSVYTVASWLYSDRIMDERSRELAGSLAVSQQTVESLRRQEAEQRANYELVRRFTEVLPATPDASFGGLLVDDAHEARQVHMHVVWLREPYTFASKHSHLVPYYIVGRSVAEEAEADDSQIKGSPMTYLLLCSARRGVEKDALKVVAVRDQELKIAETAVQEASFRDLDPEEVMQMFHRGSGKLRVSSNDGMRTQLTDGYNLAEVPRWRDPVRQVKKKGMSALDFGSYDMRIEDEDLAIYDVVATLSKLATAFSKKDELLALLSNYGRAPESEATSTVERAE